MKYTLRRPVEAMRFAEDGSNWREICTFMGDTTDYDNDPMWSEEVGKIPEFLCVEYQELCRGDWLIKESAHNVVGDVFSVASNNVFEATYIEYAGDLNL